MSAQRETCSAFVLLGSLYFKFVTALKKSTEVVRLSYMCLVASYVARGKYFLATELQITLNDTSQTARFTVDQS